jgi:hypothetical protein
MAKLKTKFKEDWLKVHIISIGDWLKVHIIPIGRLAQGTYHITIHHITR